jgi:uncharacterized membrane protein YdjX (TVP38/TMEM64 family)
MLWFRVAAFLVLVGALVAAWTWGPGLPISPDALATMVAPHRHAWYGLPIVVLSFVLLGLVLFPVLMLIAATGMAFGPVLGPIYAMAGSLASASAGFAVGRWLGRRRVERLMGERAGRIMSMLHRNGTLAVFLARKVPAPFTLANLAIGASSIGYIDFVVGTTLGMAAAVVALAGLGSQLSSLLRDPSPETFATAALLVTIPLGAAVVITRRLRRARADA